MKLSSPDIPIPFVAEVSSNHHRDLDRCMAFIETDVITALKRVLPAYQEFIEIVLVWSLTTILEDS